MNNPHDSIHQQIRRTTSAIALYGMAGANLIAGLILVSGAAHNDPFTKTVTAFGTGMILIVGAATIHGNIAAEKREQQQVRPH